MITRSLIFVAACAVLAGCNESRVSPAQNAALPKLNVGFDWCGSGSPSFKIGGLPATAKTLDLKLVDRDVPTWNHGGGSVPATSAIPCGAISGAYNGPNPPAGQVHTYEWTVTARDAGGAPVATGTASRKYPE